MSVDLLPPVMQSTHREPPQLISAKLKSYLGLVQALLLHLLCPVYLQTPLVRLDEMMTCLGVCFAFLLRRKVS